MNWFYLMPIMVGIVGVIQGGLNQRLGDKIGLLGAVAMNNAVGFIFSMLLMFGVLYGIGSTKGMFSIDPSGLKSLQWWFWIPGICGFLVVLGIPFSMKSLGATKVFLLIIAAQLVSSILWDFFVEGLGVSWERLVGSALALSGAYLVVFRG